MLVRKRAEITETAQISLPGAEPRGAFAVTLAGRITVVGVHLGLLRRSRRKQLAAITVRLGDTKPTLPA